MTGMGVAKLMGATGTIKPMKVMGIRSANWAKGSCRVKSSKATAFILQASKLATKQTSNWALKMLRNHWSRLPSCWAKGSGNFELSTQENVCWLLGAKHQRAKLTDVVVCHHFYCIVMLLWLWLCCYQP